MNEIDALRKQLEDAGQQIASLSKEIADLKAAASMRETSIAEGARYSLKLEIYETFLKLVKDASEIQDTHEHARTFGSLLWLSASGEIF